MSDVTRFPLQQTVERVPNDARLEMAFSVVEGMEPARQKRLLMQMRQDDIGWLDDQQVQLAIDALGLKHI